MKKQQRKQRAMSLLEIMVVVTIMGIIAAVVVVNIAGKTDEARGVAAKAQMKNFSLAIDMYNMENSSYPSALKDLTKPNKNGQPYMKEIPKDPWGRDYIYRTTPNGYEIISYGADQRKGGTGKNEDIVFTN